MDLQILFSRTFPLAMPFWVLMIRLAAHQFVHRRGLLPTDALHGKLLVRRSALTPRRAVRPATAPGSGRA
jgi:hypothetical protein